MRVFGAGGVEENRIDWVMGLETLNKIEEGDAGGVNKVTIDELRQAHSVLTQVKRFDRIHTAQNINLILERQVGDTQFGAVSCISDDKLTVGDKQLVMPFNDAYRLHYVTTKPIKWWDSWFRDCAGVQVNILENQNNIVVASRTDSRSVAVRFNSCEANKITPYRPPTADLIILQFESDNEVLRVADFIAKEQFRAVAAIQRTVYLPQITPTPKMGYVGGSRLTYYHETDARPTENAIHPDQYRNSKVLLVNEDAEKYAKINEFYKIR